MIKIVKRTQETLQFAGGDVPPFEFKLVRVALQSAAASTYR